MPHPPSRLVFAIILTAAFCQYAVAQETALYDSLWSEVDALDSEGLARSARDKAAQILELARNRSDDDQTLKALLYRARYTAQLEEDEINTVVGDLRLEIGRLDPVAGSVLRSVLGEVYWQYYQSRRWLLRDRGTPVEQDSDDIETWDARRLISESITQLGLSIADRESLAAVDLGQLEVLLEGSGADRYLRPTVYDLLAHRAIGILRNSETGLTEPLDTFDFKKAEFLDPAEDFVRLDITTPDPLAPQFLVLTTFQALIRLHAEDPTPDAMVAVDLERLQYVRDQGSIPDGKSVYVDRLRVLERRFQDKEIGTDVSFALASALAEAGRQYRPFGDEEIRWKLKEAREVCTAARTRFPSSAGAVNCGALNASLEARELSIQVEQSVDPGAPFRIRIDYRNVQNVFAAVVALTEEETRNWPMYRTDERRQKEADIVRRSRVTASSYRLPPESDLQQHSTELALEPVGAGLYALLVGSDESFSNENNARAIVPFASTRLGVVERNLPDGRLQIRVVDRVTGRPIGQAQVATYVMDYSTGTRFMTRNGEVRTDAEGLATPDAEERRPFALTIRKGDDMVVGVSQHYAYRYGEPEPRANRTSHFFTDRAIYRPGQTIYFKGILLLEEDGRHSVRSEENTTVELLDPNGREVGSLNLTSNRYGSVKGQFTAPLGAGTGAMVIRDAHGSVSIRVEEYKRPRFEVMFDSLAGDFGLRDTVNVTGQAKAFSGAPVDGASARYRVVRRPIIDPWMFWRVAPFDWSEAEIASGNLTTGSDGSFSLSFPAVPDPQVDPETNPRFRFEVMIDVTDLAGETHSGRTSVTVGYSSIVLSILTGESIVVEDPQAIRLSAENLNGVPVSLESRIVASRLKPPERLLRERPWERVDRPVMSRDEFVSRFPLDVYDRENDPAVWDAAETVLDRVITTSPGARVEAADIAKWKPGRYRLELSGKDARGRDVRSERIVTVLSTRAKRPPVKTLEWFVPVKTTGEPGESAAVLAGTSASDGRVFVEVERQGHISERWSLDLSNEQRLLEFPIERKDRGNFAVHLTYVRYGRLHSWSQVISVPYTDRELSIKLETFRDLLYPGSEEEWKVRISGSEGEPVVAELMATLYDASLDQFAPHNWYFSPLEYRYLRLGWQGGEWWANASGVLQGSWNRTASYRPRQYESLNLFGLNRYLYRYRFDVAFARGPDAAVMEKDAAFAQEGFAVADEATQTTAQGGDEERAPEPAPPPPGPVRTDFNETAFFFPDLETNADGETILRFRIPEALTRWRLLGLAHTPDLRFGQVAATTETRKDLVISANAPRFFREGDSVVFAANVQNLSDQTLKGTAGLTILDANSMQPLDDEFDNAAPALSFSLAPGESSGLQWSISVPPGIEMAVYRVTADAGSLTDGEQKPIPVLTNRMLITESLPLPMRGPGTKRFTFERLRNNRSTTLRHHALSLEFTPNPVWYAVQALPYMMEFPYECSEQIFSRLYANTIAAYIVQQNPAIATVFQQWKDIDAGALQSNLEKNQELKSIVIEETPWLRAALDESERKRRIGVLFDFARMAAEREQAVHQLIENQYPVGAWPWFAGMPANRYVTQHIVAGFGHLRALGVLDPTKSSTLAASIVSSLNYLDGQIKEDYDNLVASGVNLQDRHIGWIQIHFLYARSFFPEVEVAQASRIAYDYYVEQAKRYWLDNALYARGMIALALHRLGGSDVPNRIIRSLRELALHSEELGMYWKYEAGFFWYQAPIETQALLIEAFDEVAGDSQSVSDMQLWLLKQKQTQDWKTTKATTEAVYALLMRGVRLLDEGGSAVVTVGDHVVRSDDPQYAEPGTGYVFASWEGQDVSGEMANIEVRKTGPGPAWGAAYWQYFEDLDKITPAETPLRIDKKLYVERITEAGPVLDPIETHVPTRGEKVVVRVTIRVDRDMEYVHLKDMRGAGLEPINVLSEYRYRAGLGYYESTRDAATHFFIGYLPKGTYVFEYPLRANLAGEYSNGVTSIQSMYAPEFASHSAGARISIGD